MLEKPEQILSGPENTVPWQNCEFPLILGNITVQIKSLLTQNLVLDAIYLYSLCHIQCRASSTSACV